MIDNVQACLMIVFSKYLFDIRKGLWLETLMLMMKNVKKSCNLFSFFASIEFGAYKEITDI